MKKIIFLSLFCVQCLYADGSLVGYFSYLELLNLPNGNHRAGEIEVVTDPAEILKIQTMQEQRLLKRGFSTDQAAQYSRIGIVGEDQYWVWLRDAVNFPQGARGTYDRLLWRSELKNKASGVAVLPILPSGQIALILNYRHATRSWELELPRGRVEANETLEEASRRELKEETGFTTDSVTFLGEIAIDTGVLSSVIPVFAGKIISQEAAKHEYSEAIAKVITFTREELKEGLVRGFVEIFHNGSKKQVPLRDAFLTFALLHAEYRHLL